MESWKLFSVFLLVVVCNASNPPCPNSLCKGKPDGTVFALGPHYPKYFVQCTHYRAVCRPCGWNLVFSESFNTCIRPVSKPTTYTTATTTRTTAVPCPNSLCNHQPDGAIFRLSYRQPHVFVTCDHYVAFCRSCPGNLVFNEMNHIKTCVPVSYKPPVTTRRPHVPHIQCPASLCKSYGKRYVVFAYGRHKPAYYVQCVAGYAYCRKCPAHLVFNPSINVCDYPKHH